jgi:hydroxymethylglutaryl-CoA reductase
LKDSSISKFFEKSQKDRLDIVKNFANLSDEELKILENSGGITFDNADKMVENAIGTFSLPLGIATNFKINDKDYLVPMVIEEPSVIAAASKAAKIARIKGGFKLLHQRLQRLLELKVVSKLMPMSRTVLDKFKF